MFAEMEILLECLNSELNAFGCCWLESDGLKKTVHTAGRALASEWIRGEGREVENQTSSCIVLQRRNVRSVQANYSYEDQCWKQDLPDSRFEAYTHKTCTTTHKIDIKTRQKHRYNTSSISRSIFFPRNYTVVHLFFINNIDHF